jgi:hypothetical protein
MKLASLEAIAAALNGAQVPFLIAGGVAVNAHGYGRLTQDLDLVIRLAPDVVHRAFAALAGLGYGPRVPVTAEGFGDAAQRRRWTEEKGMLDSDRHRETPIDVCRFPEGRDPSRADFSESFPPVMPGFSEPFPPAGA